MAEYRLERLNDGNANEWENFNNRSIDGSYFHSLRWRELIEKTSDIPYHYFLLFKNDEVFGLLPFIEYHYGFFRGLIPPSDPHHLPVVINDSSNPLVMHDVIRELRKIKIEGKKISFVLILTVYKEILKSLNSSPLFPRMVPGHMVLDFSKATPELIWNSLSSNRRKKIRRFDKEGYILTEVHSQNDLEQFYNYYKENIEYVGGMPQPFFRFTEIWNSFPDDEIRITLLKKGTLVAGGIFHLLDSPRKIAYGTYLSMNRNLQNRYSPSYYVWWEALRWAWENNFDKFSFGAQGLDENNPRYMVKYTLGARFEPRYSAMIPLTKSFHIVLTSAAIRSRIREKSIDNPLHL